MKATYVKRKLLNTINVSKIITVHYYEFDKNFAFSGEAHNFWEMVYVDKGAVQIKADDATHILYQGEILFHKPNEFHSVKAFNCSPNFFVLSFECKSQSIKNFENYKTKLNKDLKPILSAIIKEAEKTYVIPKNDVHLKELTLKDTAEVGGEQLIKSYLEQLFIFMLRDVVQKGKPKVFLSKENMENHIVNSIKDYIEKSITQRVTLYDICEKTSYGKSYLCKLFRDYSGVSIMEYVNRCKIEYSKRLLRNSDYNITEISDMLAFLSPQYFSRVFKRITDMTPSEFKQSLKQ